jgi:cyclophilin family peptidyl-prolyl cis-trans isomerase
VYIRLFFIFLLIVITASCNDNDGEIYAAHKIKELEISRNGNPQAWEKLYNSLSVEYQIETLNAIAKTKNDSLVPFLKHRLETETSDAVLDAVIFALGQTGSKKAELILLDLYNKISSIPTKVKIIRALEKCGSTLSVPIIVEALNNAPLRKYALQTAAILARKKLDVHLIKQRLSDSTWTYFGLKENAYFILQSVDTSDFLIITENLTATKFTTRKYYLKALAKLTSNQKSFLKARLDSALIKKVHSSLKSIILNDTLWQNKMYALKSFSAFADSSDGPLVKSIITNSKGHLKIMAFKTYASILPEKATSFLLNHFKSEHNFTIKGQLINLITQNSPKIGYRLIQQNLDKGTISFKEDLLNALALKDNPFTKNTLKSFLSVNEKRLVYSAFSILNKKGQITFGDIKNLMHTEYYSVLFSVLDWQKTKKQIVSTDQLIEAFQKFNQPDEFETQELILELLAAKSEKLSEEELSTLTQNISTQRIRTQFHAQYPNFLLRENKEAQNIPAYLSVDSILTLPSKNIFVEITTNKGEIKLELFSKVAPITVKNFLELAKSGFYTNLIFHRVVADFVIQGGDPTGNGWGGAGYLIHSEDFLDFERGTIGIATSGFNTGSCQFFICQSEQPHLRGSYTAFGKVIKGMDVVDNIQVDDVILSIKAISLN